MGPREGSQVMVTPVREVQAAAAAVSSVPAPAVSPASAVKAATSVSQDPVRPAGLAVGTGLVGQMGGSQGVVDPAVLAVEEIRKRVMREAEEQYVPTGGWVWVPEGGGQPSPQQGGRPPTPPSGIQSGYPLGNQATPAQPGSSLTETL